VGITVIYQDKNKAAMITSGKAKPLIKKEVLVPT